MFFRSVLLPYMSLDVISIELTGKNVTSVLINHESTVSDAWNAL